MKLELLMTYKATLKPGVPMGQGPIGTRTFAEVTGGTFEGPKLKGKLLTGGGDWILIDGGGMGHVDVRANFETDDGARIYAQYLGRLEMNDAIMQALGSGNDSDYGDTYFMTSPRFETGDERYAWLNHKVCVAEGRVLNGGVEYRCYTVEND